MSRQSVKLVGPKQRNYAKSLIDAAPQGFQVTISQATRSIDQNAKMWAMLTDISADRPGGRQATPDVWKVLFMHGLGHEIRFEQALEGPDLVPMLFKTSSLKVGQMADLIEFIYAYGSAKGVQWSEAKRAGYDV